MTKLRFPRWILLIALLNWTLGCNGSSTVTKDTGSQTDTAGQDSSSPDVTTADSTADTSQPDQLGSDSVSTDSTADVTAETTTGNETMAYWDYDSATSATSTNLNFFNYPWPEMQRKKPDGTLNMAGFPNPEGDDCTVTSNNQFVGILLNAMPQHDYRQYIVDVTGKAATDFGNNTAIYVRFSGPLNAALPNPGETLEASSPIFLVNVDESAADKTHLGERVPVSARVFYTSRYAHPNTLSVMPYPGFSLRPATTYALVVRRSLKTLNGSDLGLNPAFEKLKGANPSGTQATEYKRVFDFLETKGVARSEIAVMTVFRTQDPVKTLKSVAERTEQLDSALANVIIDNVEDKTTYYRVVGRVTIPIYQQGTPPYLPKIEVPEPTGDLVSDVNLLLNPDEYTVTLDPNNTNGQLLDQAVNTTNNAPDTAPRLEEISFYLAIPKDLLDNAANSLELPLVLYGHGTGGSKNSPYSGNPSVVSELLLEGIATFSIDGVMHKDRAHADNIDPELLTGLDKIKEALKTILPDLDPAQLLKNVVGAGTFFFNPLNVYAGKGNVMQSGVDFIWLAKALKGTTLMVNNKSVTFKQNQVFFFGHSQGGLTGPLLALSKHTNALFLSAPGGHLINSLLEKTKPDSTINIKETIRYLVCETNPDENMVMQHPILNAMMTMYEEGDPLNYARHIAYKPLDGYPAKHFFMTEGVTDEYAPRGTNEPISTAAFLYQLGPVMQGTDAQNNPITYTVFGQTYLDALVTTYPNTYPGLDFSLKSSAIMGNLHNGTITAGFRQYLGGHFVSSDDAQARKDWKYFFNTLLDSNLAAPKIGAID